MQNHTGEILKWISNQNIIDCIKTGRFEIPKNLLNQSSFALKNNKKENKDNNMRYNEVNNDMRKSTENNFLNDYESVKHKNK